MIELSNLAIPLDGGLPSGQHLLYDAVTRAFKKAGIFGAVANGAFPSCGAVDSTCSIRILKKSVDARKKSDVHFVMTLGVDLDGTAVDLDGAAIADVDLDGDTAAAGKAGKAGKAAIEIDIVEKLCRAGFAAKVHKPYEPLVIEDLGSKLDELEEELRGAVVADGVSAATDVSAAEGAVVADGVSAAADAVAAEGAVAADGVSAATDVSAAEGAVVAEGAVADIDFERPHVVVIGTGPAGLFAGLALARAGLAPVIIERGAPIDERIRQVEAFNFGAPLNPDSNIQFGEGGAGTFSDGKLTTNIKNPLTAHVLNWFVDAGAPQSILVDAKPHIGTDILRSVVKTMREQIIAAGGTVHFNMQVIGVHAPDGKVKSVQVLDITTSRVVTIEASHVVLACGHSARDTFFKLWQQGVPMEQKPFSVGVRIEHFQEAINIAQYGDAASHPAIGPADYKLACHLDNGRSVYTFCMCPGGEVVCATSETGAVVVNGMSNHDRAGENANSALLVNVEPSDFGSDHPLAGVAFQQKLEHAAYEYAVKNHGAPYQAPCQTVADFLGLVDDVLAEDSLADDNFDGDFGTQPSQPCQSGQLCQDDSLADEVFATYPRGVIGCDLHEILPDFVSESLEAALPIFDKKIKGFAAPGAIMTGVETRSSSPVRILRDETCQSTLAGLYPCGEGAGYAGGIMSAAVDGLRVALAITNDIERIIESEHARAAAIKMNPNFVEETRAAQAFQRTENAIAAAASVLRDGGTAIFPTDTVYGLGVSVAHAKSPKTLYTLKGRDEGKPIALLVGSSEDLARYGVDVPPEAIELARAHWPGALTIIVKASDAVAPAYRATDGSIGLRMPDNPTVLALIERVGAALATTSANLSGMPAAAELTDIDPSLLVRCDAVVSDAEPRSGVASTVISCVDPSRGIEVLRQGAIKL